MDEEKRNKNGSGGLAADAGRQYEEIFKYSQDAIFLLEATEDGRFRNLDCNPAFERSVGIPRAALIGKFTDETVPEEVARKVNLKYSKCVETGAVLDEEVELDLPVGRRTYRSTLIPIRVESGRVGRIIGVTHDITEIRQANKGLEVKERKFRTLVENTPDIIVRYDRECLRTYVNPAYEREIGITSGEAIGRPPRDDWPSVASANEYKAALRGVLETGKTEDIVVEGTHRGDVLSWLSFRIAAERDERGLVVGALSIGRDLGPQKTLELRLRKLMENSPGVSFILHVAADGSASMPYISPRYTEFVGTRPDGFASDAMPMENLVFPEDLPLVREKFMESARSQAPLSCEFRARKEAGGTIWIEIRGTPQADADGGITWYGYFQEIDERKRMEETLQRSELNLNRAQAVSKTGSFRFTIPGNHLAWSDETYRIFGIPIGAPVSGAMIVERAYPEDAPWLSRIFAEAVEGIPFDIEYRILVGSETKWLRARTENYYNGSGVPVEGVGTVQDITEMKRTEGKLKESEALYRKYSQLLASIFESPSQVSIYALDREYRYLAFNKRHREGAKFLWGSDIAVGMSMLQAINTEEHRQFCRRGFDRVLRGESYSVESKESVVRDGRPAYEYRDNYASPIFGDDGEVVGLTIFAISINDRKLAERRLAQALEFSEGVINAIPDMLFEVDRDGRYLNVWTKTPELLAAPKEELLGKTIHDALAPEAAAIALASIREAETKGLSFGNSFRIDLPSGPAWFEQSVSRKPGGDPENARFLVLSRDITERKKTQERLELLDFALDHVREAAFLIHEDARFLYVNDEACRCLGYDRDSLLRLSVADIDPDWSNVRWPDHWKEIATKGSKLFTGRHKAKNGRIFPVEISANFFQFQGRAYNLALARDITDRSRAAEIKRLVELTTSIAGELSEMVADYEEVEDSPTLGGLGFSPRQIEIARFVIAGDPSKAIAANLGLTEATVKTHLAAMYRRLHVNGRMEFSKYIAQNSILLE